MSPIAVNSPPACDHNIAGDNGCDGVEALRAVVRQAEARKVTRRYEDRTAGRTDPQFEIPEPVERVRAAAGCDAATVLRPRRRVLNVPELPVSRPKPCHGVDAERGHRRYEDGGGQPSCETDAGTRFHRAYRNAKPRTRDAGIQRFSGM
jgi:hypothetical protein